jgi:hypothetical protein
LILLFHTPKTCYPVPSVDPPLVAGRIT